MARLSRAPQQQRCRDVCCSRCRPRSLAWKSGARLQPRAVRRIISLKSSAGAVRSAVRCRRFIPRPGLIWGSLAALSLSKARRRAPTNGSRTSALAGPQHHLSFARVLRLTYMSLSHPQSVHENRIYSLQITCDSSYPDRPPKITFLTRINLPCVDQNTGKVRVNEEGSEAEAALTSGAERAGRPFQDSRFGVVEAQLHS